MQIIDVRDLEKNYDSLKAVNKISFTVEKGEIFGILGPNGAGKTTTLEMMEGLRKPDDGSISINQIPVWPKPAKVKRIIGVQLQSTALFDFLKVGEIIKLFASFYKIDLSKEKLASLLEDVGLTEKSKAYVNELSGGQQQRLSIALALVNNPLVVFLDEPTTGLDPQARRHLWDVVKRINNEGITIVITTHYMEEAQYLCDRIAVMDQAKIIKLDTPLNLIKDLNADSRLTFSCNKPINIEALESLKGVSSAKALEDRLYIAFSSDVQNTIIDLLNMTKKQDVDVNDINISGANLEDVFLSLTGRALRD